MGSSESTERSMQEGNSSTGADKDQISKQAVAGAAAGVLVAGAAAGILVACGISSLLSGTKPQKNKKMMKAPGRDGYIVRDEFERDPASYFKSLRK